MYPAKELVRRILLLNACPTYYILLVHMRIRLLHIYICVLISRKSSHTAGYVSAFYSHIRACGCYICVRRSRRTSNGTTGALLVLYFLFPPPLLSRTGALVFITARLYYCCVVKTQQQ
jgi:hypothetical protein